MPPLVSILLPNLNNRSYLDERIQTILVQTHQAWELIVVDNYSDDGAWEFFQDLAQRESRVRIAQAPRQGMYANWNNCLRLAKGKYVYIATSDDTMAVDFLEKMIAALERHPECDLAHCKLKIIDENGLPHPTLPWDKFYSTVYFGDLIHQSHIRLAPHDGLLHCGVKTVYTSITQLLIRKSIFDRVGFFLTGYDSLADFEWEMRASLVANIIHVPSYLATWRVHCQQGTDLDFLHSPAHRKKLLRMMGHALKAAKKIAPELLRKVRKRELTYYYQKEKLALEIQEKKKRARTKLYKYQLGLKWLLTEPRILRAFFSAIKHKQAFVSGLEPLEFSRRILRKHGVADHVQIIQEENGCQ